MGGHELVLHSDDRLYETFRGTPRHMELLGGDTPASVHIMGADCQVVRVNDLLRLIVFSKFAVVCHGNDFVVPTLSLLVSQKINLPVILIGWEDSPRSRADLSRLCHALELTGWNKDHPTKFELFRNEHTPKMLETSR